MAYMVQSIELLLDDATDRAVRDQWDRLAAAGLPSQRLVTAPSNRPHITLAVHDLIESEADSAAAAGLRFDGFPIRLGAPLVFGVRNATLARLVVPSRELLEFHRHVNDLLGSGRPHTDPDRWTAHVTLARRVRPDQVGAAIGLLLGADDIEGTATAVRRWDGDQRVEWLVAWEESM